MNSVLILCKGSGSILDALDYDTTIIAVPNPALMGNHQSEIAEEMEKQGFLTQGKLGYVPITTTHFTIHTHPSICIF